jgi:hypothetical protein
MGWRAQRPRNAGNCGTTSRTGSNNAISVHFVGSIVYIETGLSQVTHQSPLLVIDGQQRLTTVTLLVAALASPGAYEQYGLLEHA